MLKHGLLLFSFCLILFSCGVNDPGTGEGFDFDRLCGKWMDISEDTAFNEEWRKASEGLYEGRGYVLSENDTVFIETLAIEVEGTKAVYQAQVSNQNKERKIPFEALEQKKNKVVFENVQHDFPQRIIYELKSNEELRVAIEGYENGVYRKLKFDFKRAE